MGVALSLGFHARQTNIIYAVLPLIAIVVCPDSLQKKCKGLLLGVIGALIGLTMVVGLILAVGDWQGYLYTVFEAPRKYKGHYWLGVVCLMNLREQAIFLMLSASTLVAVTRERQRFFLLALALLGLATIILPMRPFPHYWKQLFPIICLMVPEALSRLSPGRAPKVGIAAVLGYLAISAVMTFGYTGFVRTNMPGHRNRAAADQVANEIRNAAHPGDSLFVVGPLSAYLHFATDLKPVNRLFWDFFLETQLIELSGARPEEVFDSYRANPPDILVIEKTIESRLMLDQSLDVRQEYQDLLKDLLKSMGYQVVSEQGDYRILRRTDATNAVAPSVQP